MKTSKELSNELKEADNKLKELGAQAKKMDAEKYPFDEVYLKGFKNINEEKYNHNKEIEKRQNDLYIIERDEKIKRHYIINNLKFALLNENKNAVIEVLKKYSGKKYGEKTREKIAKEIEEKTGGKWARIEGYKNTEIELKFNELPGCYNDQILKYYTEWDEVNKVRPQLLTDNTIQTPEELNFNGQYIEDIEHRCEQVKNAFENTLKAFKEYEEAAKLYRGLKVDGLRDLNYTYLNVSRMSDIVDR